MSGNELSAADILAFQTKRRLDSTRWGTRRRGLTQGTTMGQRHLQRIAAPRICAHFQPDVVFGAAAVTVVTACIDARAEVTVFPAIHRLSSHRPQHATSKGAAGA